MKCVDCGFDIHECICKECEPGDGLTIIPSSVGSSDGITLHFDLESSSSGQYLCSYAKVVDIYRPLVEEVRSGLEDAKRFFRDRGFNV